MNVIKYTKLTQYHSWKKHDFYEDLNKILANINT